MDRLEGSPAPAAGATLRLQFPPDPRYSRYVRERVWAFATSQRMPRADASEFVAALSEAVANALEHSASEDTIEVTCWLVGTDQILATVVDHGIGFAPDRISPQPAADPLAERGRGMPIMRRFADLLSVRTAPGQGTAVVLGRALRRPDASSAQELGA